MAGADLDSGGFNLAVNPALHQQKRQAFLKK